MVTYLHGQTIEDDNPVKLNGEDNLGIVFRACLSSIVSGREK